MRRGWSGVLATGLLVLFASMPAWGQTGSAVIEDIERQVRQTRRKQSNDIPLKGFFYICAYGSAADVEKALAAGADPKAGDPDNDNMPPLATAASSNPDPGVIQALVAAGADPGEASGKDRRTPLHFAIMTNPRAEKVVGALLLADADVYALDRFQSTPIDFAINGNYRNGAFDANPREELLLMLLRTAERLPFTMPRGDRKSFMTKKLRQYDINMGRGWRDGDVIDAFKRLGADERIIKKGAFGT